MKRFLAMLMALLLLLPLGRAAELAYYPAEGYLSAGSGTPLALRVRDERLSALLAMETPAESAVVPLTGAAFTLAEATVQADSRETALDILNAYFLLPDTGLLSFESAEGGFALLAPVPVLIKDAALLEGAALVSEGGEKSLASLNAGDYPGQGARYIGHATTRSASNVREKPDQYSYRVVVLQKNSTVPCVGKEGIWYRVELPDGREGYVAEKLVDFVPVLTPRDVSALLAKGDADGAMGLLSEPDFAYARGSVQRYIRFAEAAALEKAGDFAGARAMYGTLGAFGGADARAQSLQGMESMPTETVLQDAALPYSACEIRVVAAREGNPYCVKIIKEGETEPVAVLFVPSKGMAKVAVPAGRYFIQYASGDKWYGIKETFGDTGAYAALREAVTLAETGARAVITLYPEKEANAAHSDIAAGDFNGL